jgi:hypothetical protein
MDILGVIACCGDYFLCPGIVFLNEDIDGYLVINEYARDIDTEERNIITNDRSCVCATFRGSVNELAVSSIGITVDPGSCPACGLDLNDLVPTLRNLRKTCHTGTL